ncbi:MAG TPA: methyltransferase domain-containing protein [Acidimicrobiales bacterium]|nr:methyltransferase domain-containing protein [Acidimicrobiales bacterium]
MEPESDPAGRVDALVAELRARVEQRRTEGAYPPGLEDELEAHFRRVAPRRETVDVEELRERLADLDARIAFDLDRISTESRLPGGEALHRSVAKVVARQTEGVLAQVQEYADGVRSMLGLLVEVLESHYGPFHERLADQIDAVMQRLDSYERGPVDSAAAVGDLRRRVGALEAAERRRQFRPTYENERFEEEFRGTREVLRERYRDLAGQLAGCSPVIDVGCGRGEFLELLDHDGVEAYGVEIDPVLVEAARRSGLDVRLEDGVHALARLDDGSLGGVALIQVVEHLTPQEVVEVVSLLAGKLRAGGRAVVETVNPQSLYVFAHSFYLDPTHVAPVHPAYLAFLFREAGFSDVSIDWRSPPPGSDVLEEVDGDGDLGKAVNEHVRRLNRLLFGPQDYAVIATR